MIAFILKVIIASCGLVGTTAVTFIAMRLHKWMDGHDAFKSDTTTALTVTIPNQIKSMSADVTETHNQMMSVFSEELRPLHDRIGNAELNIKKLKVHTKYKDGDS